MSLIRAYSDGSSISHVRSRRSERRMRLVLLLLPAHRSHRRSRISRKLCISSTAVFRHCPGTADASAYLPRRHTGFRALVDQPPQIFIIDKVFPRNRLYIIIPLQRLAKFKQLARRLISKMPSSAPDLPYQSRLSAHRSHRESCF